MIVLNTWTVTSLRDTVQWTWTLLRSRHTPKCVSIRAIHQTIVLAGERHRTSTSNPSAISGPWLSSSRIDIYETWRIQTSGTYYNWLYISFNDIVPIRSPWIVWLCCGFNSSAAVWWFSDTQKLRNNLRYVFCFVLLIQLLTPSVSVNQANRKISLSP